MLDRLLLLAAFSLFAGWHWGQLERPTLAGSELLLLALLAAAPAALAALVPARRRLILLVGIPVAAVAAAWRVTGFVPWDRDHRFFPFRTADLVWAGVRDWFQTRTPFDPGRFPAVDVDVRLGFFVIVLGLALLLLCSRRPLVAIGLALVPVALPGTVLALDRPLLRAGIFLALALATLHVFRGGEPTRRLRGAPAAAVFGAIVVAAGLVVGQAPGVSKAAYLDWQHWNPIDAEGERVGVGYVWDQDYGPLRWPKQKTVVFEATSPRPSYWRAAVLEHFDGRGWRSDVAPTNAGVDDEAVIVPDDFLPPGAAEPRADERLEVRFRILALADDHLLSPATALRYGIPDGVEPTLNADGTVSTSADVPRDAEYDVLAYAANPRPAQLAAAGDAYPLEVRERLTVNGIQIPTWGSVPDSERTNVPITVDYERAVARIWQESGADEATTQFAAVNALETFFRSPAFTYDQTPAGYGDGMPLVEFMTTVRSGYCQMFAASMALVLRLHGIPARVAVGFTEGTAPVEPGDPYVISDRDAHAWVEVYFPGYGWLPFDPTPSRTLPTRYSMSNTDLSGQDLQGFAPYAGGIAKDEIARRVRIAAAGRPGGLQPRLDGRTRNPGPRGGVSVVATEQSDDRGRFLVWAIGAGAVVLAVLAAAKAVMVRWRYLRRGPRAQAAAAYHELATFLGDQGVDAGPQLTFEELAQRAREGFGVDAGQFAAAATTARYAPRARARAAAHDVRRELRSVKRALRGQLSRRDRVAGALRLRTALAHAARME
jgi:protein-glutamine gamma-glutamyltransferase